MKKWYPRNPSFYITVVGINCGINIITNVYGQDEEGHIETDNEISSQLGSELVTNETVPLADNQNDTSMLNFSESGVREFDNLQLQC